ncbi:MAG TPA: Gfo/Idh/MocA family oxidoreductase [Lacipirellula sp.]
MPRLATRRSFIQGSLAAGAALALPTSILRAAAANDEVNIGLIGCGGRGSELLKMFHKIEGVNIAALCDPDQERTGALKKEYGQATTHTDLREVLDDKSIDAVIIATCNHWHALAAIWAMDAGKDVYVEKPLASTHWEGQQVVAAADRYRRICQVGTQQRSDPMQAEIREFLHEKKALGELQSVRANRYGVREPIGNRKSPLEPPTSVDYNLWLGPAQDEPLYRNKLHYDWHWSWNTGSGEMGNWGVHILDDVRNTVFQDKVKMPSKVAGGGRRVVWNDAGETPNLHFAYFDAGGVPVVLGLCNLTASPESKRSPECPGPGSGYIAYYEGGRLEGQRGKAVAFDKDGKEIKQFNGTGGNDVHQANFIDAVRSRDVASLNTTAEVGLYSTGWCHLANIAFRAGEKLSHERVEEINRQSPRCEELVNELAAVLDAHQVDHGSPQLRMSEVLLFDPEAEKFIGDDADAANKLLTREYREGFVVPEVSKAATQQARA